MNDSGAVSFLQCIKDLGQYWNAGFRCVRPFPSQDVRECAPLQQLHRDIMDALIFAEIIDTANVSVRHPSCKNYFSFETIQRFWIIAQRGAHHLQCDCNAKHRVGCPKNDTHSTLSDLFKNLVTFRKKITRLKVC